MANIRQKWTVRILFFTLVALLGCFVYSQRKLSIRSSLIALKRTALESSSLLARFNTIERNTEHLFAISNNSQQYPDLSQIEIPRFSHPKLRRALSEKEHAEMRKLLFELDNIFTENNITYLMVYGTLLGSYFVHDILPWDDDLDLFVREPDQQRVLDLFKGSKYDHMEAYHHTGHSSKMVKIYYKNSPRAGKYPWRWPFADVTTYKDDQDSICCIHDVKSPRNRVEKSSFYPLHRRPFAGLWLPAPRDPLKFLRQKYQTFVCKSHTWSHREEKGRRAERVGCEKVKEYYPTVYRSPDENGVRETLKLGKKVLYSVHVDEPFGEQLGPFNLGKTTKT